MEQVGAVMTAAQHAKVWKGAADRISGVMDDMRPYKGTYSAMQAVLLFCNAIATEYEIASEEESGD